MPADLPDSPSPLAEISQGPSAFEQFLDKNQKNLIVFAILLALAAVALVVYRGVEKSRQQTAGAALAKADDLAALQAVVKEHAGTQAASSATVLLAERQWDAGQQDAAIASLRDFIASSPDHAATPAAQASLGAKLMAQGKSAEAVTRFQQLIDDPKAHYIAPYAMICLGDLAKAAGDLERAESHYNRVKTDFPESTFASTAGKRGASLRAKPPVEVEPPPPAPPQATVTPSAPPTPAPAPPAVEAAPAPEVPQD